MNTPDPDYEDKIIQVIEDYVEPNAHVLAMERIHRNFTGESISFSSFDQAINYYSNYEWTPEEVRDFISICKNVVEGVQGKVSETYFKILSNDQLDQRNIREELERKEYKPQAKGEAREGFQWEVGNEFINGRYIYVDVDTHVSYNGEINELVTESSLEFRIDLEENILILESTSVIDVQKTKSVFSKRTNLELRVLFNPMDNSEGQNSKEIFEEFLNRIECDSVEEISVMEITEVSLRHHDPNRLSEEQAADKMIIEGRDIFESQEVVEHISQGWHLSKISAKIRYSEEIFRLTVAGSPVMSYATISEFKNRNKARELLDIIRYQYYKMAEIFNSI